MAFEDEGGMEISLTARDAEAEPGIGLQKVQG